MTVMTSSLVLNIVSRIEHGKPLDCGLGDEKSNLKPLIDLQPLLGGPKRKRRKKDAEPNHSEDADVEPNQPKLDTYPLLLLPTSKAVSYSQSAGFRALLLYKRLFHAKQFAELEQVLGRAKWTGHFLMRGEIFDLHGKHVLSLGFHGFAALVWSVKRITLQDGSYIFSMKDSCLTFQNDKSI